MIDKVADLVWPESLMIRDTGLHDDLSGGGQRIYTTAGRGYETRQYVLATTPQAKTDISLQDKIWVAEALETLGLLSKVLQKYRIPFHVDTREWIKELDQRLTDLKADMTAVKEIADVLIKNGIPGYMAFATVAGRSLERGSK